MTSDRPYRAGMSGDVAVERIRRGAGSQFDPAIVDVFLSVVGGEPARSRLEVGEPAVDHAPLDATSLPGRILPVHRSELLVLHEMSADPTKIFDLTQLSERAVSVLHRAVGAYCFGAYLVQSGEREAIMTAVAGGPGVTKGHSIPLDWGSIGRAAAQRLPVISNRRDGADLVPAMLSEADWQAVFPFLAEGQVAGFIVVEGPGDRNLSQDEVYLMNAAVNRLSDAAQMARYHEQLVFAANHDGLTGQFNHGYFYQVLEGEVRRAEAAGRPLSVAILDLNNLKHINDTHGHQAGDAALREFAGHLQRLMRGSDLVARYGGDEFAVILPGTDAPAARLAIERSLDRMPTVFNFGGRDVPMPSAACGVVSYPKDGDRAAELVAAADALMYRHKQGMKEAGRSDEAAAASLPVIRLGTLPQRG